MVVDFEERDFLAPGETPRQSQVAVSGPDVVQDNSVAHGHDPAAAPTQSHDAAPTEVPGVTPTP